MDLPAFFELARRLGGRALHVRTEIAGLC
jgi:hypothetical protein